jgi:hypothetical protein
VKKLKAGLLGFFPIPIEILAVVSIARGIRIDNARPGG